MKREERDEMVQYFIQVREKIKMFKPEFGIVESTMKEIELKIEQNNAIIPLLREVKEKILSLEPKLLNLEKETSNMKTEINREIEKLETKKTALIDFIDNYKTLIINTPIEKEIPPKKRTLLNKLLGD